MADSVEDVRREAPRRYIVDLDLPPEERWRQIATDYASQWRVLVEQMWSALATHHEESLTESEGELGRENVMDREFADHLAAAVLQGLAMAGLSDVALELRSMAQLGGVSLTDMVLIHLSYETTAACTALVCYADGLPAIARTLDWDQAALRALTIDVDLHRGGRLLYQSTTWAGFLGVLTACKPGCFALAVNKREDYRSENPLDSDDEEDTHQTAWPVCFLMRYVLEHCESVQEARAELIRQPLMAPTFVSLVGMRDGEGYVITRDEKPGAFRERSLLSPSTISSSALRLGSSADLTRFESDGDCPFIVQTNEDHWKSPANDEDLTDSMPRRRRTLEWALEHAGIFRREDLFAFLRLDPVEDVACTVYSSVLCPAFAERPLESECFLPSDAYVERVLAIRDAEGANSTSSFASVPRRVILLIASLFAWESAS